MKNLTKDLHIRISAVEHEALQAVANAEGVTVSALVRQRVQESLLFDSPSEWE